MGLSYASGPSTVPLLGQTIGDNLEETVARFGDREALVVVHEGKRFTYRQLNDEVDKAARLLMAMGLEVGDRLGIWAANCAAWTIVQYATAKIGVILVNINPAYRTNEVEYVLRQSGCRMLIAAETFKTSNYRAMVEEARPNLPDLEFVLHIDSQEWKEWLAGPQASDENLRQRMHSLSFDDPINIQYTSGTTGFPKGATLTHHNILNNGYFSARSCNYTEADRVCIPVPLYHCFGMVIGNLGCTTHGATMVYPAPSFDPLDTLRAIETERCTSVYGVPTMFIGQLTHPDFATFDLSSLRTGVMGGSPCPVETMKQAIDLMNMREVAIAYGMTETSPVSTQTAADDTLEQRTGTVGRVHPHVEVKIVDPITGRCVERGQSGELCTRGYSVMLGYWNDPEKTAEAIDRAGWMHTGDLAVMDDAGYINIVGRSKDMIIRGGENVYPREIEEFLYTHPDIVDVQVVGVPDLKLGEEIMAWVRVREGAATLNAEAVRAYCQGQIAHYKIPRYVHVVDEFPMTVTGKIQKFKLREAAVELLGLHDAAAIRTA
ncbi:MAG: AMP-binding protein [Ilumatobacteraceae bacterium]